MSERYDIEMTFRVAVTSDLYPQIYQCSNKNLNFNKMLNINYFLLDQF